MSQVTVAALQLAFTDDVQENIAAVSDLVREAAGKGARLILPPELFEGHYFCRTHDEAHFARALPVGEHPAVPAVDDEVGDGDGVGHGGLQGENSTPDELNGR